MATKIYTIPAGNLGRLEEKLAELNKKCKRLALALITLTVVATKRVLQAADLHGMPRPDKVYLEVEITGETPKLAGWELLAVLVIEEGGVLIRKVPGVELELTKYRELKTAQWCDHCQTVRYRTETFVLRHESGQVKQVGRQCLKDFLGHENPHRLGAMAEMLFAIEQFAEGLDEDRDGSRGECVAALDQYLEYVAAEIRMNGWFSRTKAKELDCPATADLAWRVLFPADSEVAREMAREFSAAMLPEDKELAQAALAFAKEKLEEDEGLNDYEHNLRVVVVGEFIKARLAGIAASLITFYTRELGKQAKKASEKASQWFGTIGKRETFELTVIRVPVYASDFGTVFVNTFVDAAGNLAVWKTSKCLQVGTKYAVKGTVKRHMEWKDIKQTELSRCSITEVEA